MTERLLTVDEAAQMLGRTPLAVYRMIERRRIPFRKDGRRVLFLQSEIAAFIDALPSHGSMLIFGAGRLRCGQAMQRTGRAAVYP